MLWQLFPMKPVRISENMFKSQDWSGWLMERKYDGFRCLLIVDRDSTSTLWTRERKPIAMPDNLRSQVPSLKLPPGTILDGEIWTPTKRGSWRHDKTVLCNLTFWDVLRAGSENLCQEGLEKRHERLSRLVGQGTANISTVEQYSPTASSFDDALRIAKLHRNNTDSRSGFIHGVVLKKSGSPRRDSPMRCIEHPDWMKVCFDGMDSGQIR